MIYNCASMSTQGKTALNDPTIHLMWSSQRRGGGKNRRYTQKKKEKETKMRRILTLSPCALSAASALVGRCNAFTTFADLKAPAALPPLPFEWKEGCKPVLSARQMELHYTKHHKAYVDKFNALAPAGSPYDGQTMEKILVDLAKDSTKKVLFNQAAQHFNHTFFWHCLIPNGKPISSTLRGVIAKDFGSFEAFQAKFEEAGLANFGSGWTWLVYNPSANALQLDNTSNAGCPLVQGLVPLFTADVWEHAYYKDFENRRADFLKELWKIVNWEFVEAQYNKARK